ncbi:MAG: bifunctional [glutamine synthetase] adenylyltransferase/[glutamine synthetase]-adenylyl-L-tyrosine phosphorylase [Micrococcales bacterium]
MDNARSGSLSELARFGFSDLSGTVAKLDQLVKLVGDAGRSAVASLAKSANPDQALNALLGLAEADKNRVKKLLSKAESADRLCLVLGASSALTDFIRRQPEQISNFEKPVTVLPDQEGFTTSIRGVLNPVLASAISAKSQSPDSPFESVSCWDAIRVAYRAELLRVAIYDLTAPNSLSALPTVAAALADLAGAVIEAAIDIARAELTHSREFGTFEPNEVAATSFAVIAMGKCGARELNYISDVDVIFVADPASEAIDPQRAVEIGTKLATRMMRAIDGIATEPMLWQVDPNLRPEGKSGALVRTLDSHRSYYERWAESWEFQALLKARHLAGTRTLGEAYVSTMNPMVWVAAKRENFVESVQKMRQRVTDYIPAHEVDRQLKLGPGGLRDVEFTVQLLQLVHGRQTDELHVRDTIGAIEALVGGGFISRQDAALFADHYRFLRFLEHRIQLSELRRTHLMPESEAALRALARSVDTKLTAESLLARWEGVKTEVRGLHQKMFFKPLLSAVARLDDSSLALSDEQAIERLSGVGYLDPKGALAHIAALTSGLSRRASIQKQLLPVLLEWFARGTDPDSALLAFRRLSEDLGDSPWYLRMLRDASGAAERMTQVLSNSRLATSLFERIPEAAAWFEKSEDLIPLSLDELNTEAEAIVDRHENLGSAASALRGLRRRETLRIAMGAVLGDLTIEQVAQGLTDLTEAYLCGMGNAVRVLSAERFDGYRIGTAIDFGLVAMGRFGGGELGFGSDADVMCVYLALPGVPPEVAQKAAESMVHALRDAAKDQVLEFELDLDLRPEGRQGAVVRSLDSYRAYYARWSSDWESQALLRARMISGSPELKEQFAQLINEHRYPTVFDNKTLVEIRRIKARVENERLPQGADPKRHLKLGRGSLSDVEWLVQLLQLQHGNAHESIRTPQTLPALRACVAENLIAEHDANVLENAWLLASRVRSATVLWSNKRTDVLPVDRRQLEGAARILEYPAFSASQLEQDYLAATRRSRAVFERLFFGWEAKSLQDD